MSTNQEYRLKNDDIVIQSVMSFQILMCEMFIIFSRDYSNSFLLFTEFHLRINLNIFLMLWRYNTKNLSVFKINREALCDESTLRFLFYISIT